MSMVPAIVTQILKRPNMLEGVDLSSITTLAVGSAAITSVQKQEILKIFAARGAMEGRAEESSMPNTYGMSEVCLLSLGSMTRLYRCWHPIHFSLSIIFFWYTGTLDHRRYHCLALRRSGL